MQDLKSSSSFLILFFCYKSSKNARVNYCTVADRPNRTGIEPVNGAVLHGRHTTCLWINVTNPDKVHTHDLLPDQTIPATSETLFSASSSWAAQIRPRRRVRNTTFILCLLWTFFCWGWGCPSGWRGWELVPLFIRSLCWLHVMNQWLFLLSPGLHRSHLQYSPW